MALRRNMLRNAALVLTALVWAGCRRPPVPTTAPRPPDHEPRVAVESVIRMRAEKRYHELAELIVPAYRRKTIDFMMAVDEFLGENQQLCRWIREHVGLGLSQIIDQSYVADDLSVYAGDELGVFSGQVEVLDGASVGDEGVVSYMTGERLPARQVRLRRIDGRWQYDPGGSVPDELPGAFRELAVGLRLVRQQLETGLVSPQQLRDNPERLADLVKTSLRRGVNMLSKARGGSGSVGTTP